MEQRAEHHLRAPLSPDCEARHFAHPGAQNAVSVNFIAIQRIGGESVAAVERERQGAEYFVVSTCLQRDPITRLGTGIACALLTAPRVQALHDTAAVAYCFERSQPNVKIAAFEQDLPGAERR